MKFTMARAKNHRPLRRYSDLLARNSRLIGYLIKLTNHSASTEVIFTGFVPVDGQSWRSWKALTLKD